MKKIRDLFGKYDLSWPKLILFAVIAAVYTAGMNLIPALKNTSFQDIAINPECWLLFGVFIAVNCKKWWEASLKCFVFFLISQPLIYLIEVPFNALGWGLFQYYRYWFMATVCTLPAGAAAFFLKKKNLLSVVILAAANVFLAISGVNYGLAALGNFPYHLLSALFCLGLGIFFCFVLFENRKLRRISLLIFAVAVILSGLFFGFRQSANRTKKVDLGEGSWTMASVSQDIVEVTQHDGRTLTVKAKKNGNVTLHFENADGKILDVYVTVTAGSLWVDVLEAE